MVVECHPRLVGRRALAFGELLDGKLEVAIGLETVHPLALARLGKEMTLDDFDRAAELLRDAGLRLRAFVLVGAPFVPPEEDARWVAESAALRLRARRGRRLAHPGARRQRRARGARAAGRVHAAAARDARGRARRLRQARRRRGPADLWDLERLASCPACFAARRERLERMNRTGVAEPRIACTECDGA